MLTRGSILFKVLAIAMMIVLIISVVRFITVNDDEPFTFAKLLSVLNGQNMPSNLKSELIPKDWLDWNDLDLGDWSIEFGSIGSISFNFIRDIIYTFIDAVNAILYIGVGILNTIPFITWVLGQVIR